LGYFWGFFLLAMDKTIFGDLYMLRNMIGLSDFLGGKRFTDNSGGKEY